MCFFLTDHIQGQILPEAYRLISSGMSFYVTEHIPVGAFASYLFTIVSPDCKNSIYHQFRRVDASIQHPETLNPAYHITKLF